MSEISGKRDETHVGVVVADCLGQLFGAIFASVVDENDLVRGPLRVEC